MNEDNFILEDIDRELTFEEKVNKIVDEFNPEAVEYTADDNNGWSVKIKDQKSGMDFWVDVWIDTNYNDVSVEWNQYIFDTNNANDNLKNAVQENNSVFDLATSEAINYLQEQNIIEQDDKANWYVVYHTPAGEFYEIYDEKFNTETGDIEGAGRIWNIDTGEEQEFVFTYNLKDDFVEFNDFDTGDKLDIKNDNLINEIKMFKDDHKDEISECVIIDENKELKTEVEVKKKFMLSYDDYMPVMYDPEDMDLENAIKDYIENELDGVTGVNPDDISVEYLDEDKKVEEDKQEEYKYNGYTFIPVGNVKSNLNLSDFIVWDKKLNSIFNADNGTYNYDELYKVLPSYDIFKIPELNDVLVVPGSRYLFKFYGKPDKYVPVTEIPNEEELKTPNSDGYIGTEEDKEVIDDLLDNNKDYMDISSKYGYSFNDYQLYNIATLYEKADDTVKTKIEDVLENINYHSECSEIIDNAGAFKSSLFESKKTEDVNKELNLDDIADYIKGIVDYNVSITPTGNGFSSYDVNFLNTDDSIMYSVMVNDDAIGDKVRLLNTLIIQLKRLYSGYTFADGIREDLLNELNKIHPVNKKTEDVAINNGFNITKYPEVQNLANDIANSLKDKEKVTINTVIEAIENWDNGFSSVITALATADKNLANEIEKDEYDRYEVENQFLGLVEDTLNDMGITVYDEYDESKKVESRPDKEAARNRYHSQLRKKLNLPDKLTSIDEITNYIDKVDDPVGFLYIIDKIAVPDEADFEYKYKNDNPNAISALSYYMREVAEDLYAKYRFDGDRYVDDEEVAELMKPELVKALKEYTPEKSNEIMPKTEDVTQENNLDIPVCDESKKVESRPDKETAISNYYNKIKRRLNIPKGGLKSKEEIIDYINKVDDAIGFKVIANSISFPTDELNGNFNRYVSIAADELNDKYRWDNDKYLDDDDPKLVEPMKKELIKLVQDFELDKYYDLVDKFEESYKKTDGILKNIQKQDEIDEWEVFDAEIDEELGKSIIDTFKNYEDDEDDVIPNVRIDYNTDDGSYTVAYIDMFGGFHQINYELTDEELAELKGDRKTEDATQCGAVDGGRVSIFGEKEKIEEDNEHFSYIASRDVKETLNDLLSGNYDIMYDYNVENFVDDLIDYLDTLDDNKAHSIAWELNQACISAERSNRKASGTKPRKLIQALKSAKAYLDNTKKTESKDLSKVEKLKLMDEAARSVNDEEIIDIWLMNGVPDEASELDYEEIAEDEENYREIEKEFKRVMKLAVEDGLYQCPPQAFEFAKTYEPDLENID